MTEQGDGVFAPSKPTDTVDWPDAFGSRFTIFVDTEEEFDWTAPFRRNGWGVSAMAELPAAHRRFADRDIDVGYLIDYPIATEPVAIDAIREIVGYGRATIGTQLHPWVNPPFVEAVDTRNSFAGNLPIAVEAEKLDRLTAAVTHAAGERPIVYRAGRYGLGPSSLALLAARGYRIDTSMRSAYDYSAQHGPDYRSVPADAFRTGPDHGLIELPLTTIFTGRLRRGGIGLYNRLANVSHGPGIAARSGLLSRVALTPEDMPLADALEAIRVGVGDGMRLFNLSYHSPSVVPGHTPFVRDAADLATFWAWWDAVLDLLDRLGVRSASVAEILATQPVRPVATSAKPTAMAPSAVGSMR